MKKILTYYSFIIVTLIVVTGFFNAQTLAQLVGAVFFFPLAAYFGFLIFPRKRRAIIIPEKPLLKTEEKTPEDNLTVESVENGTVEGEIIEEGFDLNRRMFLKLIGSAGLSVFFFSLFTKKAEAAFFGSAPGPGTVAIKNIAGEKIDPAEKHPTDGYRIARVDDSSPSYYGYINKDGEWFIMIEEDDGTYKYAKGSSSFLATGWNIRNTTLEYDDFDEVF